MGASLYHLHGASDFDSRAGFDLNTSHVFPQGVLSAIILLGGRVRRCEKPEKGIWVKERSGFRKLPLRTTGYILPLLTSTTELFRFSTDLKLVTYNLHLRHGSPDYNDS